MFRGLTVEIGNIRKKKKRGKRGLQGISCKIPVENPSKLFSRLSRESRGK